MELKVWSPFYEIEKEFRSMRDRFPSFFGELTTFDFRPITDMRREEGNLIVTAELPGIDPQKDVEITVEEGMLVITGEKTEEKEVHEEDRYLCERHFGSFERRLPLPDGVDPETISASYDKGILTVTVPIPELTVEERRSIPITVS